METRINRPSRETGTAVGGEGRGLLVALAALACPLLCLGPLLLAGLGSTGLARALRGAPWPLAVVAVLIVMALGIWGVRVQGGRRAQDCCTPIPGRLPHDEMMR